MILEKLSIFFGIPAALMKAYCLHASWKYKVYYISKRNNKGKRLIAQPRKEIKEIQRKVIDIFLSKININQAAFAYVKERNILNHAERHKNNKFLLKLDFKDFFYSIKSDDFLKYVDDNPTDSEMIRELSQDDKILLKHLLFWKPKKSILPTQDFVLSIGAPSSPILSNIIMYSFDKHVDVFCKEKGVVYSRYADDLAFSTNIPNILGEVERYIIELCNSSIYPKLELNKRKTVHTSKRNNRHLTGLVITNDNNISIGYKKKRFIKSLLFKFKMNSLCDKERMFLKGYLSFIKDVEPSYIEKLERKYSKETLMTIMHH